MVLTLSISAATPPPRKENGTFDPGVIQEAARKILESLSRNQISGMPINLLSGEMMAT